MSNKLVQKLETDGLAVMDTACPIELTEALWNTFQYRYEKINAVLNRKKIGIGSHAGYQEIVQRSPGRWDIPITPEEFGIDEKNTFWWPLISSVLGETAEHSFSGVVFSEPQSPAQHWHVDSPHISATHKPAHALNVMLALHDIPIKMGPTEYACGSHFLTNHLHNQSLRMEKLIYQHAETSPECLVDKNSLYTSKTYAAELLQGSCQIFDDRLLHRGLANLSKTNRYIAYFSYRRKGYISNTHFESQKSLFNN